MLALSDARDRNSLFETFSPLNGAESPLSEDMSNWTYVDVSGAIGGLLFYGKNPARSLLEQSDMLKNFVSNGVYSFDTELIDDFVISDTFDTVFVDGKTGDFDVNFEINMNYEDQEWIALVGNVDSAYRILDIVKAEELGNFIVYNGVVEEEVEQEVVTQTQTEVNEVPEEIVNVPAQEEQVGEPYSQTIMQDPYEGAPNYTGPREGYYYSWRKGDYLPLPPADYYGPIGEDLMGNIPASKEEYEAAGGTYCENCY